MPSVRPADKPRLAQPRQDPAEHVVASAHADALSGVRDRGVHGHLLRRGDAQPGAQAQRVLALLRHPQVPFAKTGAASV